MIIYFALSVKLSYDFRLVLQRRGGGDTIAKNHRRISKWNENQTRDLRSHPKSHHLIPFFGDGSTLKVRENYLVGDWRVLGMTFLPEWLHSCTSKSSYPGGISSKRAQGL